VVIFFTGIEYLNIIKVTGRKKLIIATINDFACLQSLILDTVKEGFDDHAVIEASGAVSILERKSYNCYSCSVWYHVRNWWSIGAELRADWRRDEAIRRPFAIVFRDPPAGWCHLLNTATAYGNGEMVLPSEK